MHSSLKIQVMSFYTIIEGEKTLQKGNRWEQKCYLVNLLVSLGILFYFSYMYMQVYAYLSGDTGVQKEAVRSLGARSQAVVNTLMWCCKSYSRRIANTGNHFILSPASLVNLLRRYQYPRITRQSYFGVRKLQREMPQFKSKMFQSSD